MAAVDFVDIYWLADMLLPSHVPPLVVSLLSRYIVWYFCRATPCIVSTLPSARRSSGCLRPAPTVRVIRYDTIRYDTRCYFNVRSKANMSQLAVSLIYRTEPTTKKCKNRKTKLRKQICSEITVNSLGNPCSESWRRKREGWSRKDLQKRKVLSLEWKSEWVMEYQIIVRGHLL